MPNVEKQAQKDLHDCSRHHHCRRLQHHTKTSYSHRIKLFQQPKKPVNYYMVQYYSRTNLPIYQEDY